MRRATAAILTAFVSRAAGPTAQHGGGPAARHVPTELGVDPLVTTVYPAAEPKGLMVTSGGWAYCEEIRALSRRSRYTLLCGR